MKNKVIGIILTISMISTLTACGGAVPTATAEAPANAETIADATTNEATEAVAEDPCMKDIGILISLDPVAIDQACLDLVYAAVDDPGQGHLIERIESQNGVHTIEAAAKLGLGLREYELIEVK